MAYQVELEVTGYGNLVAPDGAFPVSSGLHDWTTPYPAVADPVPFTWEPGKLGVRPNVFWYPQIRDWVCDELAHDVLMQHAVADLHLIAHGDVDGKPVFVLQAAPVLSVVDREASIIRRYPTYERLDFPAFYRSAADAISSRVFRVPGSVAMVFMGDAVKAALDEAAVTGMRFTPIDWSDAEVP